MISDYQNGVGHSNNGFLGASSACQAMILRRQVGVLGSGSGVGGLVQGHPQSSVALGRSARTAFPGALVVAGCDPGPGCQAISGWEMALHIACQSRRP